MGVKTLNLNLGAVGALQGGADRPVYSPGWYVDPRTGQRYYYDGKQWYIYASGLLVPLNFTNRYAAPKVVPLAPGDKLQITLSFGYAGPVVSGARAYFAWGYFGALGNWAPTQEIWTTFGIPANPSATPAPNTQSYTFTIPPDVSSGLADILVQVNAGSPDVGQHDYAYNQALEISVPNIVYSARLDKILLELQDGSQLPVSPLPTRPINSLARVRVFATNTATVQENIRAKVTVYGPDNLPLSDIYDNTSHRVDAATQTQIVSSNFFGLTKSGKWSVHIDLIAGASNLPGGPVPTLVVYSTDIPICSVPALTGSIIQSQVSVNGAAPVNVPAGDVALGSTGVINVTARNTNSGAVRLKLKITVLDTSGKDYTPTPLTSPDVTAGGTYPFTSEQFKFNNSGAYTVAAQLFVLPDETTPVASLPATKLCNDVASGHTGKATVNSLKIVGWCKHGGTPGTSVVNLNPGDKLDVQVNINYSSPSADTTGDGTYAQLTYHNDVPPFDHPVAGTTVTNPIPLPATVGNKDLKYTWVIPIGSAVENGEYDIKVGIPAIGPGWEDDTVNTFPVRVSGGGGSGLAQIPRDGLSIVSWGKKGSPLGTAALTLAPGDTLEVKIGIKYTSAADDVAVTNAGISYRLAAQIKHIDAEFMSQAVRLPMSDTQTTVNPIFDIPIIAGKDGGCYNGTYGITATIPNPFPGWTVDQMDVLTVDGGSGNEQPATPISSIADIGSLIGLMVLMMIMSMMMSGMSEISAPGGVGKAAKQVIQLVLPGGKRGTE